LGIDDYIAQTERKVFTGTKDVFVTYVGQQSTGKKLLLILVVLIIAIAILWLIGSSIVGFMFTPMGILLIVLSVLAVGIYLYIRSLGFKLKSWAGSLIEIFLIFFVLIVYVGSLDVLTQAFFQIFPLILFGGVAWFGYKWYKSTEDATLRNGIIAIILAFLIAFPVYQAYVVPYTVGQSVELEVHISRGAEGEWSVFSAMNKWSLTQTMTISFNPYVIGIAETSNFMWTQINTIDKAYVDITVQDDIQNRVIYSEVQKPIYVSNSDTEIIWGVLHLPPDAFEYIRYPFRIIVTVSDEGGYTLAHSSVVYYLRS